MRRRHVLLAGVSLSLMALTSVPACDCGREDDEPVYYAGGLTHGYTYESSELHGTWLHFPGGRRYRLVHELPSAPISVSVYLAFVEDPLPEGDSGNISAATGNVALIEAVTDEYVQVRNDSCSNYYVRVVAEVDPETVGLGGGGGEGGASQVSAGTSAGGAAGIDGAAGATGTSTAGGAG